MASQYFTAADLATVLGGPSMWNDFTDGEDATIVSMLTSSVFEEADGYFRAGGYTTPLASAAAIAAVKNSLLDIAIYRANSRGSRQPTPEQERLYEAALQRLRDIAAGRFALPAATVSPESSDVGEIVSDHPLLSHEELSRW